MPGRNVVKTYVENGYYHLYNRGVEKRAIFLDKQDFAVFLSYLKLYLCPVIELMNQKKQRVNNYADCLDCLCYCLMPNHFHLLIHQYQIDAISVFMQSLQSKYTLYFNKKYKRVGSLFQGKYRAVLVNREEQLLYLTKYIHKNPTLNPHDLSEYPYSSYRNYLGLIHQQWLKTSEILTYFSASRISLSYQAFMEDCLESDMTIPLYIDVD